MLKWKLHVRAVYVARSLSYNKFYNETISFTVWVMFENKQKIW